MTAFDRAFEIVIGHEGGYSNSENDPGGETNFGISKRAHPDEDIKGMTLERAKEIYHKDYWLALEAFNLPVPIEIMLFDMAVNMGQRRAVSVMQRAAKVKDDGILGPVTRAALTAQNSRELLREITAQRIVYYADLETFKTFGLGWVRRSLKLLDEVQQPIDV